MEISKTESEDCIKEFYRRKIWEIEYFLKSYTKITWQLCFCILHGKNVDSNVTNIQHPIIQYYFFLAKELGINICKDHYGLIEASLTTNYYKTLCEIKKCSNFKHYYKILTLERKIYKCQNSFYNFTTRKSRNNPNKNSVYTKSIDKFKPISLLLMSSQVLVRNIQRYKFKDVLNLKIITNDIYFMVNSTFVLNLTNLLFCLSFKKYIDEYKGHLNLKVKYDIIIKAYPLCLCKYTNTNGKCVKSKINCKVCHLIQYCKMNNTKYKDRFKCFCA